MIFDTKSRMAELPLTVDALSAKLREMAAAGMGGAPVMLPDGQAMHAVELVADGELPAHVVLRGAAGGEAGTLGQAIAIAARAHQHQFDKGGAPYMLHPLRVMQRVTSEAEQIVAVLHDVVEDSAVTFDDLARAGFAQAVIDALRSVTKIKGESYQDFVARAARNPIGKAVKLADLAENSDLSRIATPGPKDVARLEKYRKATQYLLDH